MTYLTHPLAKRLFLATAAVAVLLTLVANWPEVVTALSGLSTWSLALATASTVVYVGSTMLCWRATLQDLGSPLRLIPATRLFFVSQLGKYIPGGVWNVVAVSEMGRGYAVPRKTSLGAMLIFWLVSVTTGLLMGLLYVMGARLPVPGGPTWAVAVLVLGLVIMSPPVLRRCLRVGVRLLRQPALVREPTSRGLLHAVAWAVIGWLAAGLQVWLLAGPLAESAVTYAAAVGGYALAWTAGFLVVVAPAGAGVRELVLGTLFVASMSTGGIVSLVLLSRFLITLVDCTFAGAALVVGRPEPAIPKTR